MKRTVIMLGIAILTTVMQLSAADPLIGTWKRNVAKSYPANTNTDRTQVFEQLHDGRWKMTQLLKPKGGPERAQTITFSFDGKPSPVTGSQWDTFSFRRMNMNAFELEASKHGVRYHETGRFVISKDGKKMNLILKGKDTKGSPVDVKDVFEKQ